MMKEISKKSFRRVMAFLLAVVMCLGMTVTAFAVEELTDEQKQQIEAVEDMLDDMPSLRQMQDARTTDFVYTNFGTQDSTVSEKTSLAAVAYDAWIAECFTKREAVQAAYDELPDDLKQYVDTELLAKLTDTLSASYNTFSHEIKAPTDESYVWQFINQRYERSNHASTNGHWCQPYVLVDATKYQGQTWTNNIGDFVVGASNYEVVYCCDDGAGTYDGTMYKRMNLEDSEYYSDEAAEHIRAIVMNSYPFVSLEKMKQNLIKFGMDTDIVEKLDYDDVIAGTLWAIWHYSNEGTEQLTYMGTRNDGANSSIAIRNHHDLVWHWWGTDSKSKKNVNENTKKETETLARFLVNLDTVEAEIEQIVINSLELAGDPVLIDEDGTYEVLLKIILNGSGSGNQDDIDITVTAGKNEVAVPVVYGTNEYAVSITAKSGDEIIAEVKGTQVLPNGVYFYAPKPMDRDNDGIATSREVSQNLVGVAVGETPVYAVDSLTFEITEEPDPVSIGLQKIGEEGEPLPGAEFTLSYDVDGDGEAEPIKTYAVDDKGFLQIDNLIADQTYVLNETTAPDGYFRLTQNIEFTVTTDGIVAENLPAGVALSEKNGLEVLTVENVKTPSILSITKSTVIGEGDNAETKPLEGITFDIYYVGTVDDYTDYVEEVAKTYGGAPEDFQAAVQEKFAVAKADEVAAGVLTPVETVTTDRTGKAIYNVTLCGQPDGVYLLIERDHPAIVEPLDPFIVAVPMTKPDGTGWDYLVEINPKNEVVPGPEVEKNVTEIGTDLDSFDVGATHTWILRGDVPVDIANGKQYVMTDVLDYRLDYQGNVKVVVGSSNLLAGKETITLTKEEDYTLTTDTATDDAGNTVDTFTVKLTADGMTKVAEAVAANTVDANADNTVNYKDMEIRVYFDSVITQDAVVGAEIPNEVTLDYLNSVGIDFKDEDDAKVYTCGINIHKYDAKDTGKSLADAEFMLARIATDAEIQDENVETETLVVARGQAREVIFVEFYNNADLSGDKVDTVITDTDGNAIIYGLEAGSYYLVETKAPADYNLLSYPVEITLNKVSHEAANTVGVANSNTFELPGTGGIGTTVFTLVGAFVSVGSGLALVGKKKKEEE